jgi:hypothetical protein
VVDERKEIPVFEGGGKSAAGKYEARLQPVSTSADRANRESGRTEPRVSDTATSLSSSVEAVTMDGGGIQVGYLGKPV